MENNVTIGEKVVYERKKRGLRQNQLAEMSDVTPKYLGQIELGRVVPADKTLRAIARALDLPEDYFLQNDGNRSDSAIRRLHFYVDLNEGEALTDEELGAVRGKVLRFAHELIDFINAQRKKD